MYQQTEFELRANWNGAIFVGIPADQLRKIRLWLFGGGGFLIFLGIVNHLMGSLSGIFIIIIGAIILFLGIFIEAVKNKKSLSGTSIDFPPTYLGFLYGMIEQFLVHYGYSYRTIQENYGIVIGEGFELHPSSVRLTIFDVKAPLTGRVIRMGIRNVDEHNHQEAIDLQIKMDNFFVYNNMIGQNPFKIRTRYLWDGKKYSPKR